MKTKLDKKDLKEFALVLGFGLPIIIGWLIPMIFGHQFRIWTLWAGIIFLLIGIIKPTILYYFYILWMKIGELLGLINSHLILGIIFMFVLLPISLFMKTTGYDPLRKKKMKISTYREKNQKKMIDLKKIF